MSKNVNHIQHLKSSVVENGQPKLPLPSALTEGEIAINYAADYETISIKNSSGNVVTFSSDVKILGIIEENEEVTACALTDLDTRIKEISGSGVSVEELSAKTVTEVSSSDESISAETTTASDGTLSVDLTTDASKIKMVGFEPDEEGYSAITSSSTISEAIKEIETQFLLDEKVISMELNDLNTRIRELSEQMANTMSSDGSINVDVNESTGELDLTTDASLITMKGFSSDISGFTGITSASTISEAVKEIETQFLIDEKIIATSLNDLNTRIDEVSEQVGNTTSSNDSINIAADPTTGELDLTTDASMIEMVGFEAEDGGLSAVTSSSTVTQAVKAIELEMLDNEFVVATAMNTLNDDLSDAMFDISSHKSDTSVHFTSSEKAQNQYKPKLSGVTNTTTAFTASTDTYYRFSNAVTTLRIQMPSIYPSYAEKFYVFFQTASSDLNITLAYASSSYPIMIPEGFTFAVDSTYELCFQFNYSKWVMTAVKLQAYS